MNNLNIHSNHPLIPFPKTDDLLTENHFVSISSQDRNLIKNPDSNDFTITLPQDYKNVVSVNLESSYFPIVDDPFSMQQNNVDLCFRFKTAFNPLDVSGCTFIDANIFAFVTENILNSNYFRIRINNGRYSQDELVTEIQNKMNNLITERMSERIYGTNTVQIWGDYIFQMKTFGSNDNIIQDNSPYMTSDSVILYYNSSLYNSIEDAIQRFNTENGTSIPIWDPIEDPSGIIIQYSSQTINNYASSSTALNPAILCSWRKDLNTELEQYLQSDASANPKTLYIQDSSSGWFAEMDAKEQFLIETGGYDHFQLIIDSVSGKINFANLAEDFEIITDKTNYYSLQVVNIINDIQTDQATLFKSLNNNPISQIINCNNTYYIDDLKWGLPVYLGLTGTETIQEYPWDNGKYLSVKGIYVPTYSYMPRDSDGYQPFKRKNDGFSQATIYLLVPTYQLDTRGEPYFFMDIKSLNCIDEISPFKDSNYSNISNISSGSLNSSFAKLPLSILDDVAFGGPQLPSKVYTPPLNRLSKITLRLRFHNGRPVVFGVQPFSFVLHITTTKLSLPK